MLNLVRPNCSDTYGIYNPTESKFLMHLRLFLSHLNNHEFNHNFKDCVNPLCSCSLSIENNVHLFHTATIFFEKASPHEQYYWDSSWFSKYLLFGSSKYQYPINSKIFRCLIDLFSRQKVLWLTILKTGHCQQRKFMNSFLMISLFKFRFSYPT